jgi:hypothetical protein
MVRTYQPKKAYFSELRVQRMAKKVVEECKEDRKQALEVFTYFKELVNKNPEDDKAKAEMTKALDLAQNANDKVVKLLALMLKMTEAEMKDKKTDSFSFEELHKK